jgi:cbb3-type cytochrome oxidase maturation protein
MFESLLVLIPIALGVSIASAAAFLWSTDSGQFDDLDGPGDRIVFDDDSAPVEARTEDTDNSPIPPTSI